MHAYTVVLSEQAKLALMQIFEYYVDIADYVVADANLTAIQTAIASLDYMPTRCPVCDFSPMIRKMVVPNLPFLIYYTITENEVHILEVIDGRRELSFLAQKYHA